jgi:hypothetical protein
VEGHCYALQESSVVAYNPLNEPAEKTGVKLLDFYGRVVKAIREVDLEHLSNDHMGL